MAFAASASISVPFKMHRLLAGAAVCGLLAIAGAAHADGLVALDNYIKTTKAGHASFTQRVSNVNKPGSAKQSSGTFSFKRPSQFRFDYQKPFAQTIVADGKTLWMYDADLNQVTRRNQAQTLSATPAALIASATSLAALQKHFHLENTPTKDVLEWVTATPKSKDGQLQNVRIGFDGNALRKLEVLDSFGQRSVIEFGEFAHTIPSDVSFRFVAPKGASVLQQ